ncbi:mannose-6-phosphate isomerase [Marivirga lumbricoides]|uniref:Phosphohexomutase n=1 Tax=Marivirga lumbricoides TaxID=1046115 RepID=A0A2T4DI76_9BACT|nr:mannose-6-phosphate isomerase [Marivirga lumbricoides]
MLNYPLKFEPILKEKIWGGEKLSTLLNKKSDQNNIGESWEISGVPGNISQVANGALKGTSLNELLEKYKGDFMGEKIYAKFGPEFPLLIKYIDAKTALSVQLHPNDDLAKARHNSFGKTEMWYIMQGDEGANINVGFKKTTSKEEYLKSLQNNQLIDLLHFENVKKGDSVFINTGKVHAIGAGVLLAEIQQTSDITYRIYDWDRVDDEGNARELHTELALDAIDFEKKDDYQLHYSKDENQSNNLAKCEYFTTNYIHLTKQLTKNYSSIDSFIIYMCISGTAKIEINNNIEKIEAGETILIPAQNKEVILQSEDCELLEVYV